MKIYATCKNCSKTIWVGGTFELRQDLQNSFGDLVHLNCKKCDSENAYRIDEMKAKSFLIPIFSIIIFSGGLAISTLLLGPFSNSHQSSVFLVPIGIAISTILALTLISSDNKKIRLFNRS